MAATSSPLLGLLLRAKARAVWNRIREMAYEAPVRLFAAVILIGVIWLGLYALFRLIFEQLNKTPLEATVAIPLVFNFFFVAMLALLTFSNAIIAYGGLFSSKEASYLLVSPVAASDIVTLKYVESLLMASWSLVLLGLPLMIAMAENTAHRTFYVLFIAFFLAFIPIPAALGLLIAFAAARLVPKRAVRALTVTGGLGVTVFVVWGMRSFSFGDVPAEAWLRGFLARMSFVQSAFLPNQWVAAGIDHAMHNNLADSLLYLAVTFANALFLSWLAVTIVSRHLAVAHDYASSRRGGAARTASAASGGVSGWVYFYLPRSMRLIAAKDLRTFFRDPLQWSQLAILFGLLVLYLTNMPTLRLSLSGSGWFLVIPFLNLCAVCLILATFTCRFVFPLVSLEGQKLWLIGLLPMPRGHILIAKFMFAMTVTTLVAVCAMVLAIIMLQLEPVWAVIHLAVVLGVCFGLCGFSVGLGARLPMFHQTNAARIANGLGGTTNLLASVALVTIVLAGVAIATIESRNLPDGAVPPPRVLALCALGILISIAAGIGAMYVGKKHFERVEV